jgi:SAM-dependent methyltransferase
MSGSEALSSDWQKRVRRWLRPLSNTPLHPQWLVSRRERVAMEDVAANLSGLVLDIGCADGLLRRYLAEGTGYLGLDYPETATRLYGSRPDVFGDAQCLPIADASVPSVALLDVLEHVPDPESAVAEIARVLAPEGTLALRVPFLYPVHDAPFDFHRWTSFGLRRLLQAHGLTILQEMPYGHPMETAALVANIALARTLVKMLESRNILAVALGLAAVVLVPLRNAIGWAFAVLARTDGMMPCGYRIICRKGAGPRD